MKKIALAFVVLFSLSSILIGCGGMYGRGGYGGYGMSSYGGYGFGQSYGGAGYGYGSPMVGGYGAGYRPGMTGAYGAGYGGTGYAGGYGMAPGYAGGGYGGGMMPVGGVPGYGGVGGGYGSAGGVGFYSNAPVVGSYVAPTVGYVTDSGGTPRALVADPGTGVRATPCQPAYYRGYASVWGPEGGCR